MSLSMVGRIRYKKWVVAAIPVIHHVTVQALDHLGNVVVLIRHKLKLSRIARI